MKRRQLAQWCIIAFLISAAMTTTAQEVRNFQFNHNGKNGIELVGQTKGNVSLEFNINEMSLTTFSYNDEEMQSIGISGISIPNAKGLPNVPAYSRVIAIPQGAEAVLRIVSYEQQLIKDVNVEPSLGVQSENDEPDMNYTKDAKVYSENAYYPAEFAMISEPTTMRGVDIVNISISPVRVNPVTKEAIVYHNIEVEIEFVGGNGHFGEDRLRSRYWDPILAQNILNYNALPVIDYEARMQDWIRNDREGYEYLIITPNNDAWAEPAQRLKEYRMQQGILTEVFRLDEIPATTTDQMKTWFHNAYNTWEIPPVAVLLFADHNTDMGQGIPAETTSHPYNGTCITDNMYADVSGDLLPEMVFSRLIAANGTEAAMMADKQIEYEYTNPNMDAASYNAPITALGWQTVRWFQLCSEVVGGYFRQIGKTPLRVNCVYEGTPGSEWSTAQNTAQVTSYFGPSGTGYIPATPTELGGFTGGTPEQIVQAINAGTMLVQHRDHGLETGWGEPAFRNTHVEQLTNVGKMPFVMSINCLTGMYNNSTPCFAEAFMRRTYNGQNAGAVGILCPTAVSYSFVNDCFVWGVYDQYIPDFLPTYGPYASREGNWLPAFGNVAGKHFLAQISWPYNDYEKDITYQMFTAHCDAFLRLYSEVPQTMTVQHQSVQLAGLQTFQVTAPEGATIALTTGEGENMEIVAVATAIGSVQNVAIPSQVPPTVLRLTVTGQNYLRYEADIDVIPASGPYVIVNSYELSGAATQLNFGDEAGLNIELKNVGNTQSPAGTVTLTSESEYVTITNGSANFTALSSNNTVNINEAFGFTVSSEVPNNTSIDFLVTITSGSDTYESHIIMKAYAPDFKIGNMTIVELDGNGNGRLDPGETVKLVFSVENKGNADSWTVINNLVMNNIFLQILNQHVVVVNSIAAGETANIEFEVYVGNAPSGFIADYTLNVASGVYTDTKDFSSKIGLNVEDFELGELNPLLWTNTSTLPWTFSTESPYEGTYCIKSGSISHSQETAITLTLDIEEADSIAFYYKVSSESYYDKLFFYIDNVEKNNWSGTVAWTKAQYAVTAGMHTFMWKYKKDTSVSSGSDCAWIDFVIMPRDKSLSASAGLDITMCEDEEAHLDGFAANYTSLEWTTSGDGTFDDATITNPIYSLGNQDIANGGVTLTMTAHKEDEMISDDVQISLVEEPVANGDTAITAFSAEPIEVSIDIENLGNFNGWTTSGTGVFSNPYSLETVYTPSNNDFDNIDLVLTAEYTGCAYKTYQHEIAVHFSHLSVNTNDAAHLNIHPNPTEGIINISVENLTSNVQITVYNNIGQVVLTQNESVENGLSTSIDIQDLTDGMYILQIRSEENIWTKKIIKK